jgi:alpha-glucoside transport system permease protein
MASQIISAIVVIIIGVGGCVAYFWGVNKFVDLIFPSRGVSGQAAITNLRRQGLVRPWLFIGPALLILTVYLIYPVVATLITSFQDKNGESFVGLANYQWALGDPQFRNSIFNNLLWLLVVPAACTFFGLVIAVLTDKIWWGTIAKSLVFLPLAISFVGASVIWKFVYEYRGDGQVQIGVLNALVQWFGGSPQVWISLPFWNNFFLMVILIWIQTVSP